MSEIIPAVIPKDFLDLEEKLGLVAGRLPMVHIDVTDGSFTPGSSWPYNDDIRSFLRIVEETEGFPYWEDVSFEVHFMVRGAGDLLDDWIKAGAERIILHLEVFDNPEELSRLLNDLRNRFSLSSSHLGVEVGIAVCLDTDLERLWPHVLEADFIQLMSISEIGKQGSKFDERVLDRVSSLKAKFKDTIISVDGGVNMDNVKQLIERGVDRLVIGSAIFGASDPEEAIEDFIEVVN
ncbi:MAG: ribulose-phosphate 3-epimerase [Parcubacteria bacterium C7867-005]|nr:MAG: ribulose-phosphate 3-epimerase [Parcubacteria bacterium C7867-005]